MISQPTKFVNVCIVLLLTTMAILAIASAWNDSAIMDEASHIPAGYSYIVKKDMRINPEHPPLVKDLAGISALIYSKISGEKINFNDTSRYWQNEINSQWSFGFDFLYNIGNNAENIIFWARIPSILMMLVLGFYVFKWARELYGRKAGLTALFLYVLSPTVLTHGRFVTTDVPTAAGIFIATYYFVKALKNPVKKNIIISGIVLGIALLLKFSAFLLIPFFILLSIIFVVRNKITYKSLFSIFYFLFSIFIIAAAVMYPVYQYHVWNYPAAPQRQEEKTAILQIDNCANLNLEKYPVSQFRDTVCILKTYGNRPLVNLAVWMSDKPILRSYGQYLLGLMMVNQRALGGNTTYFMGQVSNLGWRSYFPIVYLIKEPLVIHILTFIALIFVLMKLAAYKWANLRYAFNYGFTTMFKNRLCEFSEFISKNMTQIAMLIFITMYWIISVRSLLNIGIRHILPTIPFIYVLISGNTMKIISNFQFLISNKISNLKSQISNFVKILPYFLLFILLAWYSYVNISIFPHYLAYFNETVGGPENGYKYVVDSNLDWGQDLKRLAIWTGENNIDKIKVDYFGGGNPKYYLGDKFEPWWGSRPKNEALGGWLAVSATFLQGGRGNYVPGFKESTTHYKWLDKYTPATVIGHSIFVYDLTKIK